MPDKIFDDPRLAALYDASNPWGAGDAFYLARAGDTPVRVLDVGCGTGALACAMAARGHAVTGVDPARGMLEIARSRPGGEAVRWIESDAAGLSVEGRFDLIVMTGHVFQVFLTDADIHATLTALRSRLAPGGRLGFETRNPTAEAWRDWTAEATRRTLQVDGVGAVETCVDVTDVALPLVTFDTRVRFPDGAVSVSPSTLRFVARDELAGHLSDAGFTDVEWYGDWDGSPIKPDSPEIIVVAR